MSVCVRIDNGDSRESIVPTEQAYRAIESCYVDAQPVKDALHDGQPIRTVFAIYELREMTIPQIDADY